jgi:hypothetical protein
MNLSDEFYGDDAAADAKEVDDGVQSGGLVPAGMYHARLTEVKRKEVGSTDVEELTFTILAGPMKGRKVRKSLWLGVNKEGKSKADIEQAEQRTRNDFWTLARALGLAEKVADSSGKLSYRKKAGKRDFKDVVGADCVVKVTVREYDDKKSGEKKKSSEVGLFGGLCLDDPKAANVERGGSAAPNDDLLDLI